MLTTEERGATAVEFALLAPLVLALIGIALTAGLGMTYRVVLERGVEVAVRAVALPAQPYERGADRYRSSVMVRDAVNAATPLFDPDTILITTVDGVPVADPRTLPEGSAFRVSLTYEWTNPAAAFVAAVGGSTGTVTLASDATGVRE